MLESAKENLSKMRWFGLVEYQLASQYLFEGVEAAMGKIQNDVQRKQQQNKGMEKHEHPIAKL